MYTLAAILQSCIHELITYHVPCLCNQIQCPTDYRLWQQLVYTLFGTKWSKIHGGPIWRVDCVGREGTVPGSKSCKPAQVSVCPSSIHNSPHEFILIMLLGKKKYPSSFGQHTKKGHYSQWIYNRGRSSGRNVHVVVMFYVTMLCQQTAVSDQAAATFPANTAWWIKGGCCGFGCWFGRVSIG